MHYCVYVIIEPDTDIEESIAQALAPFDESLEVEEHRLHFGLEEVQEMARHFDVDPSHLHELARRMPEWVGYFGDVDRKGLFCMATHNPDGQWDWYEIGGRWDGYLPGSQQNVTRARDLTQNKLLRRRLPFALLTPEGEWISHHHSYLRSGKPVLKEIKPKAWLKIVRDTLAGWPDHQVVCVDIHR